MAIGRFYGMIGALMRRPTDGRYLLLKRSAEKDFGGGTWECVTGRVDQGEGFIQAAHREVREELGVEVQLDFFIETAHFYRGEAKPENEIIGILFCCSVDPSVVIQRSWEHAEHRWVTAEEAADLLAPGHWLLKTIQRAETTRSLAPAALLAFYRTDGFE